MSYTPKIRLYMNTEMNHGSIIHLEKNHAHYLKSVMRKNISDKITVFNGLDGEWTALISELNKKSGTLIAEEQIREQPSEPDMWLLFSKVKRNATENIIQKSTELGVSKIFPILTDYSNVKSGNIERYNTISIEASEQCERLSIPQIYEVQSLSNLLKTWDTSRIIIFCDESGGGMPIKEQLGKLKNKKHAMLIGPEGGFSSSELDLLRKLPYAIPVGLGPRILRADTAAIAALTAIQMFLGDWSDKPNFE